MVSLLFGRFWFLITEILKVFEVLSSHTGSIALFLIAGHRFLKTFHTRVHLLNICLEILDCFVQLFDFSLLLVDIFEAFLLLSSLLIRSDKFAMIISS